MLVGRVDGNRGIGFFARPYWLYGLNWFCVVKLFLIYGFDSNGDVGLRAQSVCEV